MRTSNATVVEPTFTASSKDGDIMLSPIPFRRQVHGQLARTVGLEPCQYVPAEIPDRLSAQADRRYAQPFDLSRFQLEPSRHLVPGQDSIESRGDRHWEGTIPIRSGGLRPEAMGPREGPPGVSCVTAFLLRPRVFLNLVGSLLLLRGWPPVDGLEVQTGPGDVVLQLSEIGEVSIQGLEHLDEEIGAHPPICGEQVEGQRVQGGETFVEETIRLRDKPRRGPAVPALLQGPGKAARQTRSQRFGIALDLGVARREGDPRLDAAHLPAGRACAHTHLRGDLLIAPALAPQLRHFVDRALGHAVPRAGLGGMAPPTWTTRTHRATTRTAG